MTMVYWFLKVAQNSAKSQNYAIDIPEEKSLFEAL
jgi:hypothetical protein